MEVNKDNNDNSQFMEILARSVAHELRTPLAIININLGLLEFSYESILSNSANTRPAEKEKLLKEPLEFIKCAVKLATHALDNISVTLKTVVSNKIKTSNFQCSSISSVIESALSNYPFLNSELKLIKWDKKNDFTYLGDNVLTQHVFSNLIKNALHAIKEMGKGKITIRQEIGKQSNKLIFTDTALGITPEDATKLFEQLETQKPATVSAGLGLIFCKVVMNTYGGTITCNSKKGKCTEFVLEFPNVK